MDVSKRMSVFVGLLCLYLVGQSVCQQLFVAHAPPHVIVQQQEKTPLSASDVPNIINKLFGIAGSQSGQWAGLKSQSLFKRPKANVLLSVATVKSPEEHAIKPQNLATFPLENDLSLVDLSPVMDSIQSYFTTQDPLLLEFMAENNAFDVNTPNDIFRALPNSLRSVSDLLLDKDSVLSRVNAGSLNSSSTPDVWFLSELQMIVHILKTLHQIQDVLSSKVPDLFSFVINGLKRVCDAYGTNSNQCKDSHRLLSDFIDMMTNDFRKIYKDNVVVEVVTMPAPEKGLIRKSRSLLQNPDTTTTTVNPPTPTSNGLNLAWDYRQEFPAMYNIILWLSFTLAITVFVIAYGMWNMDPGRDSIIYRMTSQRLKKD